jgi:uncharacterized membrane protein
VKRRAELNRAMSSAQVAYKSVQPNTLSMSKVAHLASELEAIHSDNMLYWKHGAEATREARAKYQQKQDRIEEIRAALVEVSSPMKPKETERSAVSETTEEFEAQDSPTTPTDCESP